MARRRTKAKGKNGWSLQTWLRPDTIGAILVVLALLMLLSLLTSNRSSLVGSLVAELRVLFGIGIWLVPLVIGALGFWLVLRQIADQEVLSGRRIVAAVAFFLAFEALAHLILLGAEVDPRAVSTGSAGGGVLGWAIVQMLAGILDVPGTVLALVVLLVAALLGLSGLTFGQIQEWLAESLDRLRGRGRDDGTFAPPLPFGEPVSRWRRGWQRLFPPRTPPLPPPVFGRPPAPRLDQPVTPRQIGQSPHINLPGTSAAGPVTTTPPVRTNPAPTAAGSAAAGGGTVTRDVSPRLGGSGQSWRLPVTGEVLEDVSEYDIKSEDLRQRAQIIEKTLDGFGVPVQVVEINPGPAVTQFGLRPGIIVRKNRKGEEKRIKVRVSQIQALSNDLALALAASPLRIEAPVPGKDVVGVEVPNVQVSMVSLRGVMESEEFRVSRGPLIFGLGRDVSGSAAIADLARMPHLLIAGATGSGKSVCVNAIITTLLLTHTPESLRFLMIDPKRVELTVYNGIPHLIAPVVVDVERAVPVLQWATKEMERRYKLFAKMSARNIESYNEKLAARGEPLLPYIVILIDELADLMLSAPEDVERYICRLAQMARATGMHLVIATQRPSVDVVTGLIKANFPARIAFAVTSQVDSRVILDTPGAEQLLGRGDMLFMAPDASKLQRLQGCYVSDRETQKLVQYWKGVHTVDTGQPRAGAAIAGGDDEAEGPAALPATATGSAAEPPWLPGQESLQQPLWDEMLAQEASGEDDMYRQAVDEVRRAGRASVSLLQRRLRIGYSRAARLIDELEAKGVIGPDLGGSRGREVLPAESETGN